MQSKRMVVALIGLLFCQAEAGWFSRKTLQAAAPAEAWSGERCINTSPKNLQVDGGLDLFKLNAKGYVRFYCNDTVLSLNHAEAFADVQSADGVWVGKHEYPVDGVYVGMPTWFLTNTVTGEKRTIWGDNKPIVRQPAPDGNDLDWWRRAMFHDISSYDTVSPTDNFTIISGPSQPKAYYAIRTDTTSDPQPKTPVCANSVDVDVPFTAVYDFVSCDVDKAPLTPVPSLAPVALPPAIIALPPAQVVPTVAPAPLIVAVVPAPTPALPPKVSPPNVPIIPVIPVAVAPAPSSAYSVFSGVLVSMMSVAVAAFGLF